MCVRFQLADGFRWPNRYKMAQPDTNCIRQQKCATSCFYSRAVAFHTVAVSQNKFIKKIEYKLTTGPGSPRSPLAPLIPGPPCLTQTNHRVGSQSTHWDHRGCSYYQHLSWVTRSQVGSSECNSQTTSVWAACDHMSTKLSSSVKKEEGVTTRS